MKFPTHIKIAQQYSKSSVERLEAMMNSLLHINSEKVEGDVVECGVWKGGNIILARLVAPERKCWLYDTFDGMTKPSKQDVKSDGFSALDKYNDHVVKNNIKWDAVDVHEVRDNMIKEGVYDPEKFRFIIGDVCETLLKEDNLPEKIALLRLDTDWYASTKKELEVLWPRLVSRGVLIVDDYNHWMGARQAVNEYLCAADRARLKPIDYTAVMMVKP